MGGRLPGVIGAAVTQGADGEGGDGVRHADTPELAREALVDSVALIFKGQARARRRPTPELLAKEAVMQIGRLRPRSRPGARAPRRARAAARRRTSRGRARGGADWHAHRPIVARVCMRMPDVQPDKACATLA